MDVATQSPTAVRASRIHRRALLEDHRLSERQQKSLALLELIRQRGPLTRTELSQGTGFNIVTVSNYVTEFIKQGLVVERGFDVSTGGRKPVLVELNPSAGYAVGIDLGPMDWPNIVMRGVLTDLRGHIVHQRIRSRGAVNMDQVVALTGELIRDLLSSSPVDTSKVQGIGVGLPGIVDERAGTVRDTTRSGIRTSYVGQQEQWEGEFAMPVFMGNDASLAGYGEYRLGLDRSIENMIYLYSEVGASVILHGQVFWGSCGSTGELGVRMPADDDYLQWINTPSFMTPNDRELGITTRAKQLLQDGHATSLRKLCEGNGDRVTLDMVLRAATDGDRLSRDVIEHAAMQLGIRIAGMVNLLNPEVVVIGGGIERAGALLLEPVWRAVKRYSYEEPANLVDVLPAKLGENAVALGAACWVIREVFIQA